MPELLQQCALETYELYSTLSPI